MKEHVDALWDRETGEQAFRWLLDRGLTAESIWEFQLGYNRGRNAIYIPYLVDELEIAHRWRLLSPGDGPKYLSPRGQQSHIYNVQATAAPAGAEYYHVYVTEGEFDCMILRQLGHAAVGIAGVTSFRKEWRYLFEDCDAVTICFDQDEAGERGANRLQAWIGDITEVSRLVLPPGVSDVNEAYLAGKLEATLAAA